MDDKRLESLMGARFELVTKISQVELLSQYLVPNELTTLLAEQILAKPTRVERVTELLNVVERRDNSAYDRLREAMIEIGEPQSLIDLLPDYNDHDENETEEQPRPMRGVVSRIENTALNVRFVAISGRFQDQIVPVRGVELPVELRPVTILSMIRGEGNEVIFKISTDMDAALKLQIYKLAGDALRYQNDQNQPEGFTVRVEQYHGNRYTICDTLGRCLLHNHEFVGQTRFNLEEFAGLMNSEKLLCLDSQLASLYRSVDGKMEFAKGKCVPVGSVLWGQRGETILTHNPVQGAMLTTTFADKTFGEVVESNLYFQPIKTLSIEIVDLRSGGHVVVVRPLKGVHELHVLSFPTLELIGKLKVGHYIAGTLALPDGRVMLKLLALDESSEPQYNLIIIDLNSCFAPW